MKDMSTGALSQELMECADLDAYLREHHAAFCGQSLTGQLHSFYKRSKLKKAALARMAGMSEVYLHQVFAGRRNPSRNRLFCLCISMKLTLEETQQLLKLAGYSPLYLRVRRDAILCYGLLHQMTWQEINSRLEEQQEKPLC